MEEQFMKGVELFNAQSFFEAHDVWEELWRETRGSHRLFYQGLIQMSVGFYHLCNTNYTGACSQFGKALSKLEQYLPAHHGIDTLRLVNRVRECLHDVELLRGGLLSRFDQAKIPQIVANEH
jgi:predicted metal-dependent hydrolase